MPPPRPLSLTACGLAAVACGLAAVSPARAGAASDRLYERALMSAADQRCHLFTPQTGRALAGARDQAHGAALRAGDAPAAVQATELRAIARAGQVDCAAPGLKLAAERLRVAFAGYAQLRDMSFPGQFASWRALRSYTGQKPGPRWTLVQVPPGFGGWLLFGTVDGAPTLLDARRDAHPAASVRLSLRDPVRAPQPYLNLRGGLLARSAPAAVCRTFLASGRLVADARLLPAGASRGVAYSFSPQALDAMARLDPREAARVELVYPFGNAERVETGAVEVGDLAAARVFLATGTALR